MSRPRVSPGDRTVHAESDTDEIVRYNRAGKWRIESKTTGESREVVVGNAAYTAAGWGYTVHLGRLGGYRFDALVRKAHRA